MPASLSEEPSRLVIYIRSSTLPKVKIQPLNFYLIFGFANNKKPDIIATLHGEVAEWPKALPC
jgi:hypothetical protein